MWKRVIVHADINHCYAQIEEMKVPELRNIPMAVGGSEESRHGIILAKNDIAKTFDIKTGESLREAFAKCPKLMIINPNYDDYMYYTEKVKDIYREYTDLVESFGLDEAWFDLTGTTKLFGDPIETAKLIQKRVYEELGLTVSMGISFNKIFAKLGSDMDKKMGFTILGPNDYKEKLYHLDCGELLYVGRATQSKLNMYGIKTIGDIANATVQSLKNILGKNGEMIWYFANGYDESEVKHFEETREVKSVGNGITAIRDLETLQDIKLVFAVLADSVASRLRDIGMKGNVISIGLRNKELERFSRQRKIMIATNISLEILDVVMRLVEENCAFDRNGKFKVPFRSISVTVSNLVPDGACVQLNMFVDEDQRREEKAIEIAMDQIRNRFGFEKIKRCSLKLDEELTDFNPKGENVIFPESWF